MVRRLSRETQRDIGQIYSRWSDYFKLLSSEGFALLFVLEGLRKPAKEQDRLHYGRLALDLGVSTNTLRRWLTRLKKAGLLTTSFVPGTRSMEFFFQISLAKGPGAASRTPVKPPARRPR